MTEAINQPLCLRNGVVVGRERFSCEPGSRHGCFGGVLVCGVLCAGVQVPGSKWELVNTREAGDAEGNE